RFTGAPVAGCDTQVLSSNRVAARGRTDGDGLFSTALVAGKEETAIGVVRCGDQTAATDPGAFALREPPRDLVAYVYTDKPVYRPRHTVRLKAVLRWRERGELLPFERKPVELAIADTNDKVVFRTMKPVDQYGSVFATYDVPAGAALGQYSI